METERQPQCNSLLAQIDPKPCTPRGMQPEKTRAKDGWVRLKLRLYVLKRHADINSINMFTTLLESPNKFLTVRLSSSYLEYLLKLWQFFMF